MYIIIYLHCSNYTFSNLIQNVVLTYRYLILNSYYTRLISFLSTQMQKTRKVEWTQEERVLFDKLFVLYGKDFGRYVPHL